MTIHPLTPAMAACNPSPIVESRRWLNGITFAPERPLLNLSQAAPVAMPPEGLRVALSEAMLHSQDAHMYGPVLGNGDLRDALAARTARLYGGDVRGDQVAITSGCNMAFTAAMSTIAGPGDEVILPLPWYFNHAMWLDMTGVGIRPLQTGAGLIPDPEAAAALINDRTRAIVLVTPNNPGGVEYSPETIAAFRDLARARGLALLIDETYRDFHSQDGAPHDLFCDPDWDDTVIHLYSFSKAYRLTGHRTGAMIASVARLREVEKYLDTVNISAAQPGQIGALWGIENLDDWLAGERAEILRRSTAMAQGMADLDHWDLLGLGAYFAYIRHPFDMSATDLARRMVAEAGILMLPGSFFRPAGDPDGAREFRVAIANIDQAQITSLFERLNALSFPLAP